MAESRRFAILIVVAALVIVCAWWMFFAPHRNLYREYRSESQIKEKLQTIKPPPDTRLLDIRASHEADWPRAKGLYSTDLDCDKVKTYYRTEFSRQGFTLRLEGKNSGSKADFVFFTTPDYSAGLNCLDPDKHPLEYMIILNRTSSRD